MLESVAQAPTLARRPGETSGLAGAVCAVAQEAWADWTEGQESRAEYRDRLERAMRARVAEELRRVEPGLPFLATVGSAAPFVGLFGTVWGIMSSFTAIAPVERHQPCRGGARHRGGAVRHRHRPRRRHPGRDRLQQVDHGTGPRRASAWTQRPPRSAGRLARDPPQQAHDRAVV